MTSRKPPTAPRSRTTSPPARGVSFSEIKPQGHRIGLYGPGGIGKTTLAATAPGPVAFIDLDDSLPILLPSLGDYNIRRVDAIANWDDIRVALHGDGWDEIKTIVIDSATKAEELAGEWVLAKIPHEKGHKVTRLEDYGYGKQFGHIHETFMVLLADLDSHVRAGRHVIFVMHDCTTSVPNPRGEDWLRWEPRLQSPSSGKSSVRLRVREWLDHLLFLGYDVEAKDGKGRGSGTRTIYPQELPFCMAKSRSLAEQIELVQFDATLWDNLFPQTS